MSKFICSLFLILICFTISIYGQEKIPMKDYDALKNTLQKQAKETSSIVADFTQEKNVSFMEKPQFSKGTFYYQQADKMRWEQNFPFNYVLLISNGKVRIKDEEKEKNLSGANKMMSQINTLMLGLINGKMFDSKEFTTKYFTFGEFYVIELSPNNKHLQSVFKTIELSFSKKTVRLKELTFFESSGDKSVMKFYNDKYNQPIPESIFSTL